MTKLKCPNCQSEKSLYKEILDDGLCEIKCCHCNWVHPKINHHADLKHIPTIQELKRDWQ